MRQRPGLRGTEAHSTGGERVGGTAAARQRHRGCKWGGDTKPTDKTFPTLLYHFLGLDELLPATYDED